MPPLDSVMTCWHCTEAQTPEAEVCHSCGRTQPPGRDLFRLLGLPRRLLLEPGVVLERARERLLRLAPGDDGVPGRETEIARERRARLADAVCALAGFGDRIEYLLELENVSRAGGWETPHELVEELAGIHASLLGEADGVASPGTADLAAATAHLRALSLGELQALAGEWDAALDSNEGDAVKSRILEKLAAALARLHFLERAARGGPPA